MSVISTGFLFFWPAEGEIIYLKANDRTEEIRSDPNGPVRPRGGCTPRKRPKLTYTTGRGLYRCLDFADTNFFYVVAAPPSREAPKPEGYEASGDDIVSGSVAVPGSGTRVRGRYGVRRA